MESVEKCREEGESKLYEYIESSEKRREQIEAKI